MNVWESQWKERRLEDDPQQENNSLTIVERPRILYQGMNKQFPYCAQD
jgi:hypothetical protein